MADWYGNCRSSYFAVKNEDLYRRFCSRWGLTKIERIAKGKKGKLYGFLVEDDNGGIPHYPAKSIGAQVALESIEDDEKEKTSDDDPFIPELAEQLADGWVAVIIEVGAEKLRYITGMATAINWKGETKYVNLESIYEHAEKLGEFTSAEG